MRTTVTLDPDVEQLLRDFSHRHRTSFKVALNDAIRRGIAGDRPTAAEPYQVEPTDLGLLPGLDPTRFDDVAADLESEAFLRVTRALESRLTP